MTDREKQMERNLMHRYAIAHKAKSFVDPMRRIRFRYAGGILFALDDHDVWVVYSENLTNQVRFNGFGNGKARI